MEIEKLFTRVGAIEEMLGRIAKHVGLDAEKVVEEIVEEIKEIVEPEPEAEAETASPVEEQDTEIDPAEQIEASEEPAAE